MCFVALPQLLMIHVSAQICYVALSAHASFAASISACSILALSSKACSMYMGRILVCACVGVCVCCVRCSPFLEVSCGCSMPGLLRCLHPSISCVCQCGARQPNECPCVDVLYACVCVLFVLSYNGVYVAACVACCAMLRASLHACMVTFSRLRFISSALSGNDPALVA